MQFSFGCAWGGRYVPISIPQTFLYLDVPFECFLLPVRYASWVKKNSELKGVMRDVLDDRESELRSHPEFHEVHEDDLGALARFREALGIGPSIFEAPQQTTREDASHDADDQSAGNTTTGSQLVTPKSAKSGGSRGRRMSTASSQRSRLSAQSSLSPLMEEKSASSGEGSEDEEEEESPPKRRKVSSGGGRRLEHSLGSNTTTSAAMGGGGVHERIEEEGEGSGASESE